MKPLKPSHKERKRYILLSGKNASRESIEKAILDFIGIMGFSESSPRFIKTNSNKIILSINRNMLDKIRASFLISGLDIKILRVSGTIKGLI